MPPTVALVAPTPVAEAAVTVGAGVVDTASTVPVSWLRLGFDELVSVAVTHAGGPAAYVGVGETGSQAPAPAFACGFHHSRLVPPFRLQSWTVVLVKVFPDDSATSKYWPEALKLGLPTGSELYWATVRAPSPVADAVVLSLVALAVPVELDDVPLVELVDPDGGEGGVGAVDGGVPPPPPPPPPPFPPPGAL